MKRRFSFLILLLLVSFLSGCRGKKEISMTGSAGDYAGKDYMVVEKELSDLGFSNITSEGLQDLDSSADPKQGTVAGVTIGGSDSYEPGMSFPMDTGVMITYHSVEEVSPPSSGENLQRHEYTILADLFTTAGFKNVHAEEVVDLDPDTTDRDYLNEVKINNMSSFGDFDLFPVDAYVSIVCHKAYAKYTVSVHVDCDANWFFDKYDVDIAVGEEPSKRLAHGESSDYEFRLREGKYPIIFISTEDRSVSSHNEIDVYSDMRTAYKITCHGTSIDVKNEYTERDVELDEGQIQMPTDYSAYSGNYSDVISSMKQLGFVNIKEAPIYDVYMGFLTTDGDISSVSIGGVTNFRRGDIFSSEDEVIVSYHASYTKDPNYIAEQEKQAKAASERAAAEAAASAEEKKLEALSGGTLADAIKVVKESGYKATYTNSNYEDRTEYVEKYMDNDYKTKCTVTSVYATSYNKTVEVYFTTPQEEANKAEHDKLDSKLSAASAWIAAEQYGKLEYPYGFKLHYYMGVLAEEPVDDNTWFLKAECTVENAYGNKLKGTCEAKVTGTSDNPKVISFYCY